MTEQEGINISFMMKLKTEFGNGSVILHCTNYDALSYLIKYTKHRKNTDCSRTYCKESRVTYDVSYVSKVW